MNVTQLSQAVESLRSSNAFRYGDAMTFSVPVLKDEIELPGPCDPADYGKLLQNKLKITVPDGARVIVVGAGNCGLVAWALEQGAGEVLAIEPRFRYEQIVDRVLSLLGEVYEDATLRSFRSWPWVKNTETLGRWDLILWPEGLDECTHPADVMETMAELLKPTGVMAIEVRHGPQAVMRGKVNSFRPSRDAWLGLCESLTGSRPTYEAPGRGENCVLYRMGRNVVVGQVKEDPKPSLPPFPRRQEQETVYKTGSNIPPAAEPPPPHPSTPAAPLTSAEPPPPPAPPPSAPKESTPEGSGGEASSDAEAGTSAPGDAPPSRTDVVDE